MSNEDTKKREELLRRTEALDGPIRERISAIRAEREHRKHREKMRARFTVIDGGKRDE